MEIEIPKSILKITRPIINWGSISYKVLAMGTATMTWILASPSDLLSILGLTALSLHLLGKLSRLLKIY
jgi:hypothetical protein